MKINTKELLAELHQIIDDCTEKVKRFKNHAPEMLNYRIEDNRWTVLECLEHLNLYGDFYIPEVEKVIISQKDTSTKTMYSPGIIGNYFAGLMKVSGNKIKKMPTPKDKNPIHSQLSLTTLERFLKQQEKWTKLLNMAAHTDLDKARTAISLTKLMKLKLGDTFRFSIYHIERHVIQAEKTLAAAEKQC